MKRINLSCFLLLITGVFAGAQDIPIRKSEVRFISSTVNVEETTDNILNLEIGFSKKIFYSVDIQDAMAAAHVIILKIVQKTGISIQLTTSVYENNQTIIADLKAKKLDLIAVLSEDLPELIEQHVVDPFLIEVEEGDIYENYILCTRKDRPGSGLKALSDKALTLSVWVESDLPTYWLDLLLNEKHLAPVHSFFSQIDRIKRPEQAIMRVFFRKSDACLVPKQTFLVLKEMNPQIAREMTIVEESPDFINGVICLNKSLTELDRRSLIEEKLVNMKRETGGEQMMDLFRIHDFLPYDTMYVHDTFEVIKQYQALKR
ncbi:PhnD/SsuA/transferrin family substrate-binding protein [bacterium]|nr:PhnD/SsuA/transferrin family substrate-binding protein [candidate division CSSED10-310 bacterium]